MSHLTVFVSSDTFDDIFCVDYPHKTQVLDFKCKIYSNKPNSKLLAVMDVQYTRLWKARKILLCHGNINIFII